MKTISYNLAKQIHDTAKEKGFKLPESELTVRFDRLSGDKRIEKYDGEHYGFYIYKVWNTDELLEILPYKIKHHNTESELYMNKLEESYAFGYKEVKGSYSPFYCTDKSQSEALGKLYLYLITNNLI